MRLFAPLLLVPKSDPLINQSLRWQRPPISTFSSSNNFSTCAEHTAHFCVLWELTYVVLNCRFFYANWLFSPLTSPNVSESMGIEPRFLRHGLVEFQCIYHFRNKHPRRPPWVIIKLDVVNRWRWCRHKFKLTPFIILQTTARWERIKWHKRFHLLSDGGKVFRQIFTDYHLRSKNALHPTFADKFYETIPVTCLPLGISYLLTWCQLNQSSTYSGKLSPGRRDQQ